MSEIFPYIMGDHHCPAKGCTTTLREREYLCPAHLALVPDALSKRVEWESRNPLSNAHYRAMQAAIDYVNDNLP